MTQQPAEFRTFPSQTPRPLDMLDGAGNWVPVQPFVTPQQFGAVTTDASAAFAAALAYGGPIVVPLGVYPIMARSNVTLTRDTTITFAPGAKIVLDAAIGAQAFTINGSSRAYSFDVSGGYFDASAVPNPTPGAGDVGTIWDLNQLRRYSVQTGEYYAGVDFTAGTGDTAIDMVNCGPGLISGCRFKGWADNAIYSTGGNLANDISDDGGPTTITGCSFEYNSCGIAVKRKNRNVMVVGNFFVRNHVCIGNYSTGDTGEPQPGDRAVISGNKFEFTGFGVVDSRGGYGEFEFTGNQVYDWGYDPITNLITSDPSCVRLNGSRDCVISGNVIAMRDWVSTTNHTGVLVSNTTIGTAAPVTYMASNNFVTANTFKNTQYAIYESAGVGPNYYLDNNCSVGVPGAGLYHMDNAQSLFSGLIAPGDWRMYGNAILMLQIAVGGTYVPSLRVNNIKVVGARDTGWTAPTGAAGSKGAFTVAAAGTPSATYLQSDIQGALNRIAAIEARIRSYDAALSNHGLIGP